MKRLWVLVPLIFIFSCSGDNNLPGTTVWKAGRAPGTIQQTPSGVRVEVPVWLDLHKELKAEAFQEIDIWADALQHRWLVVIRDPGAYWEESSPTGLTQGHVDYTPRELHVAWKSPEAFPRPLLPALEHEVGHVLYGPCKGHEGDPGCPSMFISNLGR